MKFSALLSAFALAAAAPAFAATNLVTNGSFETNSFAGWTRFGNRDFSGVTGNFSGEHPTDGFYQTYFGQAYTPGGISQSIATVAGQHYEISFDLKNFGNTPSSFAADFGATNLVSQSNTPEFAYTTFRYTAVATGASTLLSFTFRQDRTAYLLDNISVEVAAVPEPATWALMIGGFGLVGAAARRRRALAV